MSETLPSSYFGNPSRSDRILDHKVILETPTPLDELADREQEDDESLTAASEFDSHITDILTGNVPNHRNEDRRALAETFMMLSKSVAELPDEQRKSPVINDPGGLDVATYASLIVANVENPGDFLARMQSRFAELQSNNPAPQEVKDAFSSQAAELAHALYGKRYEQYEQQRQDLHLVSLESNPFDKKNRAVDKEILSTSKGLIARVDNNARRVANGWQTSIRAIRNVVARPTQLVHRVTKLVSDRRLASKERKLAKKQARIRNDPGLRGVDKLINSHRKTKADNYEKKVNDYRQNVADHRNAKYKSHVDKIEGRTRSGIEKNLARNEAFQERRQAAEARKTLRKELKARDVGYFERRKIITHLPAEKLQRIGRASCLESAASDAMLNAQNSLVMRQYEEDKLTERAADLSTRSHEAMKTSRGLEQAANNTENIDLPEVAKALDEAGKALQALEDENRSQGDAEYLAAKHHYDELADKQAFLNGKLLGLRQRQENEKKRAIHLRAKSIQLQDKIEAERHRTAQAQTKFNQEAALHKTRDEALGRVIDRSIT